LIDNFRNVNIKIRKHVSIDGVKNPEYEINGILADAKRVESAKGISTGFAKSIKQGCGIVIIDFDKHFAGRPIYYPEIARRIGWRHNDFEMDVIKECYIVHNGKAIRITKKNCTNKEWIENELKKSGM
jgi:hypothetical protein